MLTRRQVVIVSSGEEKFKETRYQEVRKDVATRNGEEVHAHQGERRMCVRAVGIYAASEV